MFGKVFWEDGKGQKWGWRGWGLGCQLGLKGQFSSRGRYEGCVHGLLIFGGYTQNGIFYSPAFLFSHKECKVKRPYGLLAGIAERF